MKIAIIGSGISGLGAAYLLKSKAEVHLFEAGENLGGHSRTIDVSLNGQTYPVDTGFIVFNPGNYPHLTALFRYLNVPFEKSDMSFGVSLGQGAFEYSSHAPFAQKNNLIRPSFWRMLWDLKRFKKVALGFLDRVQDPSMTMDDFLKWGGFSSAFSDLFLKPMGAAIWSARWSDMGGFPAVTFVQFFKNHGLLGVWGHPPWYTVSGGSRVYVDKIATLLYPHISLKTPIEKIIRKTDGVHLRDHKGNTFHFDHVICATHGDQALALLDRPTPLEKEVLGAFSYHPNQIYVHSDPSCMPRRPGVWASWVYRGNLEGEGVQEGPVSLAYWMNRLQNLKTDIPVLVTLNPSTPPPEDLIHDRWMFRHPQFTPQAIEAQKKLPALQGQERVWYCGAYQRYGFHEDGLLSAVHVAKQLGASIPWET